MKKNILKEVVCLDRISNFRYIQPNPIPVQQSPRAPPRVLLKPFTDLQKTRPTSRSSLVTCSVPVRSYSQSNIITGSSFSHNPIVVQREIHKCLIDLQFFQPERNQELDLRQARDQYLSLAKKCLFKPTKANKQKELQSDAELLREAKEKYRKKQEREKARVQRVLREKEEAKQMDVQRKIQSVSFKPRKPQVQIQQQQFSSTQQASGGGGQGMLMLFAFLFGITAIQFHYNSTQDTTSKYSPSKGPLVPSSNRFTGSPPKSEASDTKRKQRSIVKEPEPKEQKRKFSPDQDITSEIANQMKTYLKIPTEIRNLDPDWIKKAFSGQRLTTDEQYKYALWKYEKKVNKLKSILKAPNKGTFEKVRLENQFVRNRCEIGDSCEGWNSQCFQGFFGRCAKTLDPFESWDRNVKERDYSESLELFTELFGAKVFENPLGGGNDARQHLNQFFQAKYGCFVCNDVSLKWGEQNYNIDLITMWEKPKSLQKIWNLALMSLLYDRVVKFEDLDLESHYKRTAEYKTKFAERKPSPDRDWSAQKMNQRIEESRRKASLKRKTQEELDLRARIGGI